MYSDKQIKENFATSDNPPPPVLFIDKNEKFGGSCPFMMPILDKVKWSKC